MVAVVLGVDSSTQSTKVEARELVTGRVVARGTAPHPPTEPPVSEQDPEAWWSALTDAVSSLGEIRRDVVALSVAGQQHGLVLLDEHGRSVRPAKLWNDTTSAAEAERLVDRLGATRWAQATGSVPVAAFTITKLAWVAANEPASIDRTSMVMLPHDYLTWRLTGQHVTDRGDASGTGWFDPVAGSYNADLLAEAVPGGAPWLERLPTVLAPTAEAGRLGPEAAEHLGLPADVIVGPGTGDNMAAALGLGLQPGDAALSLGTSGTVYSVSATPTMDETGLVAGFASASGAFLPLACTLNATKVTDTVAAWLGTDAPGLATLAAEADGDSGGVVLVPYFDGERTPNLPHATGLFQGLRTTTTRQQLALAAHDGVLCGLLDGLDALLAVGVNLDGHLNLIGGGARSSAYRQRCADLTGRAIYLPDADEAVAAGAAVQAAAVVERGDVADVATAWGLGVGQVAEPNPGAEGATVRAAYARARPSA